MSSDHSSEGDSRISIDEQDELSLDERDEPSSPTHEPPSSPLDVSLRTDSSPLKDSSSPASSPKSDSVAPKRRCYAFSHEAPEYKAIYWPHATTSATSADGSIGNVDEYDNEQPPEVSEPVDAVADDIPRPLDEAAGSTAGSYDAPQHDSNGASEGESSCSSSSVSSDDQSETDDDCSQQQESASSSSDSEDEDSDIEVGDLKVYEGCNLSVDEGVCAVMDLFMTQKLSKNALGCVLKLIQKFLPEENNMPESKHTLFKYVYDASPVVPFKVHFFCDNCLFYIGEEEKVCSVCGSKSNNKFYQISLSAQIKILFEVQNLAQVIDKYRDLRTQRQANGKYFDTCDGSEYKRVQSPGKYNLTLLAHTDGVSISNSSHVSLWPLEFAICEVPPKLRYRLILVAGVWVATSKPNMHCFLEPFANEMQELFSEGVTWTNPHTKENEKSLVVAPFFCGDAPVRANLQNILEIAGKHSCNICEQKTVKLPKEPVIPGVRKVKRKRVFYPKENPCTLRTAQRMEAQGKVCLQVLDETGKLVPQKGVKGKSVLCKFPGCDPSTAVFPEYMHSIMGIIKQILDLIFETNLECNLKRYRDEINVFLRKVREPDYVTRCPKSTSNFSEWKANECRSFLLYLSLPLFSKFMSRKYLQHWMLFVESEYLLLQESVSENDIEKSEILIKMFLRDFSKLYTPKGLTYNLHNLNHIGLIVRRVGPLWSNSAFPWEDYNGSLQERIHGTKNQGIELVKTIQLFQCLQVLKARVELSTVNRADCQQETIFRDIIKGHRFTDEQKLLFESAGLNPKSVFYRAVSVPRGGEVFTCSVYTRQKIKNNFTVCFAEESGIKRYGEIRFFVECTHGEKVAFVNCFVIEHQRMFCHDSGIVLKHLIPIKDSTEVQIVPMERIMCKVIRVDAFVCIRPNEYEVNL